MSGNHITNGVQFEKKDFGKYRVELATEDRWDEIIMHIKKYFVTDLKINKVMPYAPNADHFDDFGKVAAISLREGVSLVAIENSTNKVIGCRISALTTKDNVAERYGLLMKDFESPHTRRTYEFALKVVGEVNPFGHYGVTRCLDFRLLSVARTHSNKGIATNLIQLSIDLARRLGCEMVLSWFVGPVSQKAAEKNGLETLKETWLKDYKVDGKVVFFDALEDVNIKIKALRL